jgi:hypothetical protein
VDQFTGRQNHFEGQHVGGGKAILEAVRSAGIFRDIASDCAHRLRRGIRRIKVTCRRHALGDVGVDHAGFHGDALVGNVSRQDAGHAGKADHDAPVIGHRSSRQAGAGAAGYEGYVMPGADAYCLLQLCGGARQNHGRRQAAQHVEAIALVGLQLVALDDQAVGAHSIA